jgi:glycosyltransferase involved in cell wall biosynthesis
MKVTVLIPTYNRPIALAATLSALTAQTYSDFKIIVSDQSDEFVGDHATIKTLASVLELHGNETTIVANHPKRGIAQQRQFLLDHCDTAYALYIDDDVILERNSIERMVNILQSEECGFVGMGLIGLSYRNDVRPNEQLIELWDDKVAPETVRPGSTAWQRYKLHNAANLLHVAERLKSENDKKYKIAWVGGCILYDTEKLRSVGGFKFWESIPTEHCGEDVLVQLRLMERYGGCGILPSGAYHQEVPTTIANREFNAPECLYEKVD